MHLFSVQCLVRGSRRLRIAEQSDLDSGLVAGDNVRVTRSGHVEVDGVRPLEVGTSGCVGDRRVQRARSDGQEGGGGRRADERSGCRVDRDRDGHVDAVRAVPERVAGDDQLRAAGDTVGTDGQLRTPLSARHQSLDRPRVSRSRAVSVRRALQQQYHSTLLAAIMAPSSESRRSAAALYTCRTTTAQLHNQRSP